MSVTFVNDRGVEIEIKPVNIWFKVIRNKKFIKLLDTPTVTVYMMKIQDEGFHERI